jgi:uncharacterized protein with GYD domain
MPKYLWQVSYSPEGAKGLLREGGSGRRQQAQDLLRAVDGKLEAFYFAFGETDCYIIADVPDHATAAAISLTVSSAGVAKTKTTVLMTPEEVDAAGKKSIHYRPPGK